MSISPLRLGTRRIEFPFVLAPMAGITDSAFRTLMKELGAGVVVSELVSSHGMMHRSGRTMDLLRFDERERPVGLQLFGESADVLAPAAVEVERLGADFVDLNLGCPVPKVVKRGAGAALLRDPVRLERVLKSIVRHLSIPLTIKIRAGWDEDEKNAPDCVKAASEAGVGWVAIHGRTRVQGYSGSADWDLIARCREVSGVPIIGNGDIVSAEEAVARLRETGCAGVMIGRGVLRNPWIFEEIRSLVEGRRTDRPAYDIVALLARHRCLLEETPDGARHGAITLRKFAAWYSHGYPGSATFRRAVFCAPTLDDVERLSREFYATVRHIPITEKGVEFFLRSGHG
jgi:nifR3 family TIM-barrel protein